MSSNNQQQSSSYGYSSSSHSTFTSSSSSSSNGQGVTKSYSENITSNDRDGTTIERRTEETGKAPQVESEHYAPGQGQQQYVTSSSGGNTSNQIEDVTDADQRYLEAMEEEYAKREGGA